MRSIGRDPVFVARGEGAELIDVEGNRYVDWVSSWGPLIAGHAHPDVVEAVVEAAQRGTSYGAPTEGEVRLATSSASSTSAAVAAPNVVPLEAASATASRMAGWA